MCKRKCKLHIMAVNQHNPILAAAAIQVRALKINLTKTTIACRSSDALISDVGNKSIKILRKAPIFWKEICWIWKEISKQH